MRATYRSLGLVVIALLAVVVLGTSATMASLATVLAAATTALIMGGTGTPIPDSAYLNGMAGNFIPGGPAMTLLGVQTPEQFWPRSGSTMTFDRSVRDGVEDLEEVLPTYQNQPAVIFGYSQSTRIASIEKRKLIAEHGDDYDSYPDWDFVLVANVNKGNGGILERFKGAYIPILGVTFDGATPTDSPVDPNSDPADPNYALDTTDITFIYDGWADFPIDPLNPLATANAALGIVYLHGTYSSLEDPQLVEQGVYGDTTYYVIGTDIVPLLMPLEQLGVPKPILLAIDEPTRVLIETAYRRDINPGEPTTAYLIPINNPVTVVVDLAESIPVGIDDGLQEMGLGRALGTSPAGIYGVGGDDADLKGLPPGLIPLGSTSTDPVRSPDVPDIDLPDITLPDLQLAQQDSVQDPTGTGGRVAVLDTPEDADAPATSLLPALPKAPKLPLPPALPKAPALPKVPAAAKPALPLIRGPIKFDPPARPPTGGPLGVRPLKKLVDALSGVKPDTGTDGSGADGSGSESESD